MEREFYSLVQASETIGCSVDDLIHYGASGHLNIIVLTTGLKGVLFDLKNQPVSGYIEIIKDRYCFIDKNDITKYESYKVNNGNKYGINVVIKVDNSGYYWKIAHDDTIPLTHISLFISAEDLKSLSHTPSQSTGEQPKPVQVNKIYSICREIGQEYMEEQRALGNDVGVNNIAKYVEAELKKRDIRGQRDDYLSSSTIKRQSLTGITGKKANGKQ